MTALLETAMLRLRALPETEQDAIAERILAELEDDARWDETFARSQDTLQRLADIARADIRAGRVREMDIDAL